MTRITAENIRMQMDSLRLQLQRLEQFNILNFNPEKCAEKEHDWVAVDSEHDHGVYNSVLMECQKCGTRQWWNYWFKDSDEEDPWTDLRPEEEEEE